MLLNKYTIFFVNFTYDLYIKRAEARYGVQNNELHKLCYLYVSTAIQNSNNLYLKKVLAPL